MEKKKRRKHNNHAIVLQIYIDYILLNIRYM